MKEKKFYQMMGRIIDFNLEDKAIAFLQNSKLFAENWQFILLDSQKNEKRDRVKELMERRKEREQNEKNN